MASPQIRTPAEIIFDNTDSTAASTPSSGQTLVGIDDVTKKLYSVNDAGVKTDYGAAGSGGGSGIMGQDEGIPLGTGTTLNVVGDNIQMTLSGSVLRIAHTDPTFPQEIIGIYGQDEGTPLGTGTVLNVVGNNVVMSISGSVLQILHTDPTFPQEVIGIFGQNQGVPLGTGVVLNVNGTRLTLSLSGTVLELTNSPDPFDNIGIMAYDDASAIGTGTIISFGSNLSVVRTGTTVFVDAVAGGGASGLGIMGQDEGTPLGTGTVLNVVGNNIAMSLSGSVLQILHTDPTFPAELIGIMGWDEGTPVGTGTVLNVVGENITLTRSGTVLELAHTNPTFPQELIGIFGQNQGVPLGTGVILNVDGTRLTLSLSGTVLRLTNSPDPAELIGVFGRNQGSNLGTGTTIDWGLGMNAAISGSVLFVHPFGGGTHGQIWKRDTGTVQGTAWDNNSYNIQFHLGDGASVVSTGSVSAGYAYVEVPDDSVIDSWTVFADATGSVKANIFRSTYAGFPPTSPLAGLGQPTLTSQRNNTGNPTGTATLAKGDILQLEVPSAATTVKLVTVALQCRKV